MQLSRAVLEQFVTKDVLNFFGFLRAKNEQLEMKTINNDTHDREIPPKRMRDYNAYNNRNILLHINQKTSTLLNKIFILFNYWSICQ